MTRRVSCDAGFSLIEALLVLASIALAGALVLPAARSPAGAAAFEAGADDLATRLREARTRAIAANADMHLDFDLAGRRYAVSHDRRAVQLPADVAVIVTMARSDLTAVGGARLTFFPDGSATGGTVRLTRGPRSIDVVVSWLTGSVGIVRTP